MKRNSLLFYTIAFSLVALSSPLPLSGQESRLSPIPEAIVGAGRAFLVSTGEGGATLYSRPAETGTGSNMYFQPILKGAALVRMNNTPIRPRQKEKRYELRGVVRSVDRPNRRATIKHEKVGDYMDAMTMPFLIRDEKALKTMQPGDQIKATLVVTDDGRQWVENIITTSKGNVSAADID
jgi:Cu/Ag efflux protein CusF